MHKKEWFWLTWRELAELDVQPVLHFVAKLAEGLMAAEPDSDSSGWCYTASNADQGSPVKKPHTGLSTGGRRPQMAPAQMWRKKKV